MFHRPRFGFSAPIARAVLRYCYVRGTALDRLLAEPGALELLLGELTGTAPEPADPAELQSQLRRAAIHLSVTASAFYGLSLEEIVVLTAFTSPRFAFTTFQRELSRERTHEGLEGTCRRWLTARSTSVESGARYGVPRWPLVGHATGFAIAVAPFDDPAELDSALSTLASQTGFAHEHYIACTPSTALRLLWREASASATTRWDPFVLDRRLRSLELGLLLVEDEEVSIYLPARYHSAPAPALIDAG